MANAEWELQKAIYTALTADSALMALINGVYDYVQEDTAIDYVTNGDDDFNVNDTKTSNGFLVYVDIHSWSECNGRKGVKQIMGEIYRILHKTALTISGFNHVGTFFDISKSFRDQDEKTYHGVQTFRIYMEQ